MTTILFVRCRTHWGGENDKLIESISSDWDDHIWNELELIDEKYGTRFNWNIVLYSFPLFQTNSCTMYVGIRYLIRYFECKCWKHGSHKYKVRFSFNISIQQPNKTSVFPIYGIIASFIWYLQSLQNAPSIFLRTLNYL